MATTGKNISRPLSKEEGFRYIEEYLGSGMSGADYYRAQGLSEWQFYSTSLIPTSKILKPNRLLDKQQKPDLIGLLLMLILL